MADRRAVRMATVVDVAAQEGRCRQVQVTLAVRHNRAAWRRSRIQVWGQSYSDGRLTKFEVWYEGEDTSKPGDVKEGYRNTP